MTEAQCNIILVIIPVVFLVALAFWKESNFLHVIAGLVAIGFGIYWINLDADWIHVIEAMAAIAVGLYMMLTTAIDLFKSRGGE
jgi:hypothetical protein